MNKLVFVCLCLIGSYVFSAEQIWIKSKFAEPGQSGEVYYLLRNHSSGPANDPHNWSPWYRYSKSGNQFVYLYSFSSDDMQSFDGRVAATLDSLITSGKWQKYRLREQPVVSQRPRPPYRPPSLPFFANPANEQPCFT